MKRKKKYRLCKICNKKFCTFGFGGHLYSHGISGKEYYDRFYKKSNEGICQVCGKPTEFVNINRGYDRCCSPKCSANYLPSIHKRRLTNLKRYSVDNPSKCDFIKRKKEKTSIRNYGVKYPMQLEENKIRFKETCIKKYGIDNPSKLDEIKKRKIHLWSIMVQIRIQRQKSLEIDLLKLA